MLGSGFEYLSWLEASFSSIIWWKWLLKGWTGALSTLFSVASATFDVAPDHSGEGSWPFGRREGQLSLSSLTICVGVNVREILLGPNVEADIGILRILVNQWVHMLSNQIMCGMVLGPISVLWSGSTYFKALEVWCCTTYLHCLTGWSNTFTFQGEWIPRSLFPQNKLKLIVLRLSIRSCNFLQTFTNIFTTSHSFDRNVDLRHNWQGTSPLRSSHSLSRSISTPKPHHLL